MFCRHLALGKLELNVVTAAVGVVTIGEIDVGKGSCIEVGRVGTCRSTG